VAQSSAVAESAPRLRDFIIVFLQGEWRPSAGRLPWAGGDGWTCMDDGGPAGAGPEGDAAPLPWGGRAGRYVPVETTWRHAEGRGIECFNTTAPPWVLRVHELNCCHAE